MKTDEAFTAAQQFYKDLGEIALEKGYEIQIDIMVQPLPLLLFCLHLEWRYLL